MIILGTDTDGLASGYQMTEVTAGGPPVLETGGNLLIGVMTLPHYEPLPLPPTPPEPSAAQPEKENETRYNRLASEMARNHLFWQLVEDGLADVQQGRYRGLGRVKKKASVL